MFNIKITTLNGSVECSSIRHLIDFCKENNITLNDSLAFTNSVADELDFGDMNQHEGDYTLKEYLIDVEKYDLFERKMKEK